MVLCNARLNVFLAQQASGFGGVGNLVTKVRPSFWSSPCVDEVGDCVCGSIGGRDLEFAS
jgi:hypothetical protein